MLRLEKLDAAGTCLAAVFFVVPAAFFAGDGVMKFPMVEEQEKEEMHQKENAGNAVQRREDKGVGGRGGQRKRE